MEAARFADFFEFFGPETKEEVRDAAVLDFGSGYGGRTVEYATRLGAKTVIGVEVYGRLVDAGTDYAASRGATNVRFVKGGQQRIPVDSSAIDCIVCYDVMEHVEDPGSILAELHRVLRPGGRLLVVFPSYLGAFSHHLDYVTLLPSLHWFFSAKSIVNAVNSILCEQGRFGTALQPEPKRSFDGARLVLPTLNGLTGKLFDELGRNQGFQVESLQWNPISVRMGRARRLLEPMNKLLMSFSETSREAFSFNCSAILKKI